MSEQPNKSERLKRGRVQAEAIVVPHQGEGGVFLLLCYVPDYHGENEPPHYYLATTDIAGYINCRNSITSYEIGVFGDLTSLVVMDRCDGIFDQDGKIVGIKFYGGKIAVTVISDDYRWKLRLPKQDEPQPDSDIRRSTGRPYSGDGD